MNEKKIRNIMIAVVALIGFGIMAWLFNSLFLKADTTDKKEEVALIEGSQQKVTQKDLEELDKELEASNDVETMTSSEKKQELSEGGQNSGVDNGYLQDSNPNDIKGLNDELKTDAVAKNFINALLSQGDEDYKTIDKYSTDSVQKKANKEKLRKKMALVYIYDDTEKKEDDKFTLKYDITVAKKLSRDQEGNETTKENPEGKGKATIVVSKIDDNWIVSDYTVDVK